MALVSAVTAAVMIGLVGCDTDPIVRDLTPSFSGLSFTAAVDSGATRQISDTLVTQDTAFVSRVDTILAPPDTVFVSVTDTVVVGTDTTFVSRTDTIVQIDTIFLPGGTDTIVTYDTVVVVQQVPVIPNVATSTSSVTLTVGQTVQLNATLQNTLGLQATSSDISWRSFNPAVAGITASGKVSGVAAGKTDVQARDTLRGLFQELPVTVTEAQAIQTFSGSTGGGPHEPAGFTPLTERDFSATSQAGWWVWDPSGNLSIVQDVTAPTGGNGLVGRVLFPQGAEASSFGPPATGFSFSPKPAEIYIAFYHKVSSSWQWHPSFNNKTIRVRDDSGEYEGGSIPFELDATGNSQAYGGTYEYRGFTGNYPVAPARYLNSNVGSVRVTAGQWAFVEMIFRHQRSPGGADGEFHMWVNGTKTAQYTDVQWMGTVSVRKWSSVKWDPVWGGTGSTITANMYQYIDDMYISGR